jgi:tRNA (cytidine/uridine-2'-O-)-methyltransferase
MLHVILYQPEIPPNTGNVMRLCANTGAALHLVHPLGFTLDERRLRRAGLDYRDLAAVTEHASLAAALQGLGVTPGSGAADAPDATVDAAAELDPHGGRVPRLYAFSTRGRVAHTDVHYGPGDVLLFGPETRGLPAEVLSSVPPPARLRLPMRAGSRSLNLSNAVAVAVYEAWRQLGFAGAGGA